MKFLLLLSIVIASNCNNCNGYRILGIMPLHVKSHFVIFESIFKGLARKGHRVDVVSPFPLKQPYPNYTDIFEFSIGMPGTVNNMTYSGIKDFFTSRFFTSFSVVHNAGNKLCEGLDLPGMQKLIKNPPNDPPYDLVIIQICAAHCFFAFGEHLKVPVVAITAPNLMTWSYDMIASPKNLAFVQNIFLNFDEPLNFYARVYNVVHTVVNDLIYNYLTLDQDRIIKKHFGPDASGVRELERKLSLVLVNAHPTLVGMRPISPALVDVGGVHAYDDDTQQLSRKIQKWLDESTSGFIFVSFGSMVKIESLPKEKIQIFYESLGKLAPIRVLMKIATAEELPPGLPKNILTSSWLPQIKVLKHKQIKLFVTHGGLMGTLEAITYGVPMIGFPLYADQFNNMDLYVKKNLAIKLDLEELTVATFDDALNKILKDPLYAKSSKAFQEEFLDRPMSAMDTAVYWIEYVIRNGGDSLRSPAMDLTWWQIELLDVYLFILFVIVVSLSITIFTIKFLMSRISNRFFTAHLKVN